MSRCFSVVVSLLCCSILLGAQFSPSHHCCGTGTSLIAITGATLIDGSGRQPIKDSVVIIQGDLITAVGTRARIKIPAGAQLIDARGLVLSPGFIDTHSHTERGLDSDPSAATQVSQGITTAVVGQDGASEWPSDGGIGFRHPRGAGSYPRVLGRFVRELRWLSLPEAIRKMTYLPAQRMKLKDRGLVRPGFKADLVLFDPQRVIDRATFEKPQLISEGIERVFVNGSEVWRDGNTTGHRPGRALRHRFVQPSIK